MANNLEIRQLSKVYGGNVQALQGVDLQIGNGLFGLLGPNGAGKSTLMRTIASLQAPSSGDVLLNGQSIVDQPMYIRQQLGYLPQAFGVYPRISAGALLDHIAVLKGIVDQAERNRQVAELLELTNLTAYQHRRVDGFSGGMLRRFGIAQALLGDPQVIIVDEPTAGLDPEERNRFLNLLSEIGQDRIILLSTHLVEDVYHLCQEMAILSEGEIRAQGNPQEMVAKLQNCIWEKAIEKEQMEQYRSEKEVLQFRMVGGQPLVSVYARQSPGEGFRSQQANLEHVYFLALSSVTQTTTHAA